MGLIDRIYSDLGLPRKNIISTANRASYSYKSYEIDKRGRGTRTIHHPSKELKVLQRWLLSNVVMNWPVHAAAGAYRAGINIAATAEQHVTSKYLLRMDISNFFPSITKTDIVAYIEGISAGLNEEDVTLFTSIVCREGKLTIGAPTSPAISNALCYSLDVELKALSEREGVSYSRYADDMFFSTGSREVLFKFPPLVTSIVEGLDIPKQLMVNQDKTRHASKRGRRQILGLVLSPDETISIGRQRKRFIRRQINEYDSLSSEEKKQLSGMLAFARDIEPDLINALILKYGAGRVASAQGR